MAVLVKKRELQMRSERPRAKTGLNRISSPMAGVDICGGRRPQIRPLISRHTRDCSAFGLPQD